MWSRGGFWQRKATRNGARTLIALLSVIVLCVTGFAWAMFRPGAGGTGTADVIGGGFSAPDGATDILLIGNDSRTDAQGNPLPKQLLQELRTTQEGGDLTDAVILVRIPNDGKSASAMSFPRDTMVDSGFGDGKHKLTETMNRGKDAERAKLQDDGVTDPKELDEKSRLAGKQALLETIEKLTGVSIDHYAEVNLLGFYEITKAVGGVEVCLNEATKDSYSGADFAKGVQTIEGADALAFVRQRHGLLNELSRGKRQQVFMSALARRILSSGTLANPAKLSDLIDAINKSVTLDPALANDILGFAEQMQGVAGGNVQFYSAPVHLVGESGQEDVTLNIAESKQFAADLLLPPQQRAQKLATLKSPTKISTSVYNASGISGLAANVLEELTSQGFQEGSSANAETRSSSVVYYANGEEDAGKMVAESLGGGIATEVSPNLSAGSVEVYIGKDYKGPGKQNFTGAPTLRLDGLNKAAPLRTQADTGNDPITADGVPCID
ncbi:LCP family protein [Saccharopolyspora sp. TS4A08]|uniref:LCP family protein n=1 Tax=Saccharopolyspora ipomoeae TaxID=3042027 RepID=A0ABT6PVW3_9PSEU|nr:LCP family protein [Saccharopolyspora sp. TS4A08]MDI2032148.1 LCP family protein [Saccharopolyspora sp. TS4A08]